MTKYAQHIKASAASFDAKEIASIVYYGIYSGDDDWRDNLEDYLSRVKLVHRLGHGGIVFVADPEIPSLWWVDVYSPGLCANFRTARILCLLCGNLGAKHLAATTFRSNVGREYLRRLGFQQVDDELFGLDLT